MEKKEFKVQRGSLELRGVIRGLSTQVKNAKGDLSKVYTKTTKKDKKYRELSFNIDTYKDGEGITESTRVRLRAFQGTVYAINKDGVMKTFDFSERNKIDKEYMVFNNVSYHEKDLNEDGKHAVRKKHAYDAIAYIAENYKDGDSVYVRANLEHSDYSDQAYTSADVVSIFFAGDDIDFKAEGYKPKRNFVQTVVYEDYEHEKEEEKYYINTRVIVNKDGSNAVVKFDVENVGLFKKFKNVPIGTEMTFVGEFYSTPKTEVVGVNDVDDEFNFADTEGYEDDIAEVVRTAKGVDTKLLLKQVMISDADGNSLIKKGEYDIDVLDNIRAEKKESISGESSDNKQNKRTSQKTHDFSDVSKDKTSDNSEESISEEDFDDEDWD